MWLLLQWPFSFLGTELTGSLPGQPMAGNISFLGHPLLLGNVGWWGNHIMENISSSCMSVTGYQYASQSVSASAPERGRFFYLGHSLLLWVWSVESYLTRIIFSYWACKARRCINCDAVFCWVKCWDLVCILRLCEGLWHTLLTSLWAELAATVIWQWSVYALPLSVGDRS